MSDPTLGKFKRSWTLLHRSLQVVRQNKRLLLFPIVTSLCSLVMLCFFLAPALFYPSGHALGEAAHWQAIYGLLGLHRVHDQPVWQPSSLFFGYLAVVYLVSMFLATFFNTAFYNEILHALAGEPVSLRAGFGFAFRHLYPILMWSLLAGTVGLIIKALEERLGWLGSWVMRLIGMAWSVASVFAIPVLIREGNPNPLTTLRHSVSMLRKTWGESLIGFIGISIGSWILVLISIVFLVAMIALAVMLHFIPLIFIAVGVWVAALLVLGFLSTIAGHIYRCALYVYASEGVVPVSFTPELMDTGWKVKKR